MVASLFTEAVFAGGHIRLSTVICFVAFMVLAIVRSDGTPFLASVAWLVGFEAVFETTQLALGHDTKLGPVHVLFWVAVGLAVVPISYRHGARPDWRILAAALAFYAVWVASGFHVNEHTGVNFDPISEVLNEASKLLWAAAYFVPLVRNQDDRAGTSIGYAAIRSGAAGAPVGTPIGVDGLPADRTA